MTTQSKLEIRPTIRGSEVVSVEVENETLALKQPIPLREFSKFIEMLEGLSVYVDFKGKSGWTYDDIEDFIFSISDNAKQFFNILAVEGRWVSRKEVLSIMDIGGSTLAGSLSSPGQYFSRKRMEPVYEKEWRRDEDDWELYYRVLERYLEMMKKVFNTL